MPIEEYLKCLQPQIENSSSFRLDEKNCKIWTGSTLNEYGRVILKIGGKYKDFYVHRLVICFKEDLSYYSDFFICHTCNNRSCFNSEHLYIGDRATNGRDRAKTITHCPHGHEYTTENTYYEARNDTHVKVCKTCIKAKPKQIRTPEQRREDSKKYYEKKKAEKEQDELLS